MAAYATVQDVQARMARQLTPEEQTLSAALLEDASVIIDSATQTASADARKIVSCRMVIRALDAGGLDGVPIGATQGSMSGLGYSQSWTMSGGASSGELYLSKQDRILLGAGNSIGSRSPVERLAHKCEVWP